MPRSVLTTWSDGVRLALSPPTAGAPPRLRGVIRRCPEDFQVTELGVPQPDGEGAHLWLDLRREDMNTAHAARTLARLAGIRERDVGYAGLKDRHARTRQWFSVPAPDDAQPFLAALAPAGLELLNAARHRRKLRRGALTGNAFLIRVAAAGIGAGDLEDALARVGRDGVPNYFGPQRFGHGGNNLGRAWRMLCEGQRVRDRHRRGLYLSAARSWLFNGVLAERVTGGSWNRLLPGEAVSLAGSGSYFVSDAVDADLERRLDAFDVHPSGPMWGRGGTPAAGEARRVELEALERFQELMPALEAVGVEASRRALRLRVADLQVHYEQDACVLAFRLVAGAYATVVLRELFQVEDASAVAASQ